LVLAQVAEAALMVVTKTVLLAVPGVQGLQAVAAAEALVVRHQEQERLAHHTHLVVVMEAGVAAE
jgi:hypothetical protein